MDKKLTIGARLYISFIGIIAIVAVVFIYYNKQNQDLIGDYANVIGVYDAISVDVERINGDCLETQISLQNMMYDNITEEAIEKIVEKFSATQKDIDSQFSYLDTIIKDSGFEESYDKLKDNIKTQEALVTEVVSLKKAGKTKEAKTVIEQKFLVAFEEARIILEEMSADSLAASHEKAIAADDRRAAVARMSTVFVVVMLVLILVVAVITIRTIRIPLKDLTENVIKLSKGDINVEIKKYRNDEIGEVAEAANALAQKNQRAAAIADKISVGDLTMTVQPETEQDVLGIALKNMVDGNNIILSSIHASASQVGSGSQQVAIASQSLAQGSTQQASAIQQVTASIDDIMERTKVNAQNANKANGLVHETKENAKQGNTQMSEMVEAMRDINDSSENISKIIKTIDDIAFQTNILALNAAVEAARAGEHGKGFAVVAEEVRNLAAKSAEAASETAELIEDSIEKVQNGSRLAETTAGKLAEIVDAVDAIVELIDGIAEASNEQANALEQVDQAVEQVSQVVQTNSATSEQCAAASEELSNQSRNLKLLVEKYKLRATNKETSFGMSNISKDSVVQPTISTADGNFGYGDFMNSNMDIPDASEFANAASDAQNEKIISLEDNEYSKY